MDAAPRKSEELVSLQASDNASVELVCAVPLVNMLVLGHVILLKKADVSKSAVSKATTSLPVHEELCDDRSSSSWMKANVSSEVLQCAGLDVSNSMSNQREDRNNRILPSSFTMTASRDTSTF